MRTSAELRRMAYMEAAAAIANKMDGMDLPDDLSEGEEEWVREYIRNEIAAQLRKKGVK